MKKVCPRCGRPLDEFPALSRKDNKTEICSKCGAQEALVNYYEYILKLEKHNKNNRRY